MLGLDDVTSQIARAFVEIRAEIIASHAPDLDSGTVKRLSTETRGLMDPDIKQVVDTFRAKVVGAYGPVRTLQWAGQRLFDDPAGY